jgi:tetratricopeptide (TPR) repeat protein
MDTSRETIPAVSGFALRLRQAVKAVDSLLYRKARTLPAALPAIHPARLGQWQLPLRDDRGTLVRYAPEEFTQLESLARHQELVRAEAEALLVHEHLGFVLLNDDEREELTLRALGVLPFNEAARFHEIAAFHDYGPKHIMIDTGHFIAGIKSIETLYGLATALSYGLLLVAGVRNREEMVKYGDMIQVFFNQLTFAPVVARALNRVGNASITSASFNTRLAILAQVRDYLHQAMPRYRGIEFRLNRVMEAVLKKATTLEAANLGFTALDAIILAKFLFHPRLVVVDAHIFIEIPFEDKSAYWDPSSPVAISFVPLKGSRPAEIYELFARSYHQIGVGNSRQGQMTKAVAAFRQALALKDDTPETYGELGLAHLRSNQPNEAIAACERAVALLPSYAEAYITWASALLTRNRLDEAIEVLKRAIRIKPNLAEAFNNLGFAYDQKGETDRAIQAYRTAIRLRPDYAHAHYNLANTYLAAQKYDLAIATYAAAVKWNPQFVRAYYNLGQALYQRRRLDEAGDAYRRVLRINPKHAGALYNLGIIYRDKGMTDKAVEMLERAVQLNPNLMR